MKWLSFAGCVVQTGAIAVGGLVDNIYVLLGALVVGGAGIGLVLPCLDSLITGGIDKKERGTITSLYSSARYIGVAVGPSAVSLLTQVSHQAVFFTISGVCAIPVLLSLLAIKPGVKSGGSENSDDAQSRPNGILNKSSRHRRPT